MRTLILVVATFLIIICGSALEGVHASSFYQPSALLVVFGPLVTYLLFALDPKGALGFLKRVFQQKLDSDDIALLDRMGSLGFLFGSISVVIGFVHVFQNLADTSRLGAGVAVALVGLVYGAVPAIIGTLITGAPLGANARKSRNYLGAAAIVALVLFGTTMFALTKTHPFM